MSATVEDVLLALEKSNLVPSALVARLRVEVTKSPPPHDPKLLVKFLVDKGHLTAAQGERLLLAPKSVAPPPQQPEPYINLDDDLGLAPLEDEPAPPKRSIPLAPVTPPPPIPAMKPASQSAAAVRSKPVAASPKIELVEEDELTEADVIDERPSALPEVPPEPEARRKIRGSDWDSQLLVLGGGGLVLLILVGGALVWSLLRTSGDEAFAMAENDYKSGSYSQAIAKFEEYLANHSGHKDVSRAKVMRGLATIRRSAEGTKDFSGALATAKTSLDEVDDEDAFAEARAELAGLLPDIAEGLASAAAAKPNQKVIDQANEALSLARQYVPAALRNAQRMKTIEENLDVTRRNLARDARLAETIKNVDEAVGKLNGLSGAEASAQLSAAYDARKQLLKDYPNLADDAKLAGAIQIVSKSEQACVTALGETRDAETTDAPSPIRATLALAARPLAGPDSAQGGVIIARLPGSLVGLNSASGAPVWRRAIGEDAYLPVVALTGSAAGDSLFADNSRSELIRIETATGKLRWRLPVNEKFTAAPALFGGEALLATQSGKLLRIELDSGRLIGGWNLPHALEVAPAVDVRRKVVYQLASHSNLYILSPDEPVCREVLYLGHEANSILTAPTAVSRYLLIAENSGLKDGVLRVVQADENGLNLTLSQSEPIGGHVDTPPLVDGRMMHVASDRGGLYVFEIGVPGRGKSLTRTAERAGALAEPRTHYPFVKDSRLWVAGADLSRFNVQAGSGKLAPDGVSLEGSYFLQPPALAGDAIMLVRQLAGGRGTSVSSISLTSGEMLWETSLASRLIGGVTPGPDGQTMLVLDAAGNQYRAAPSELGKGGIALGAGAIAEWPTNLSAADLAVTPLEQPDGTRLWMIGRQGTKLLSVAPDGAARWIALPEAASSPPQLFHGGVAIGGQEGRVYVIDPAREANLLEPYQPRAAANESLRRFGPVVVDENTLLIGDAAGKLALLAVKDEPKPHLEVAREAALDEPIAAAPVVLGKSAFAVLENNALAVIGLDTLESEKSVPLGGRPVWGPEVIEDRVYLVNAANELCCWNEAGEELWKLPLAHGPLAGAPLPKGGELVLLTRSGGVVRVGADGAELAHVDTGRSLSGRGLIVSQFVVAPGADGTLHLIPLP